MSQFVHLHLHSGFSLLDGAIDHDVLAKTAAKYGMPAVAVTDHGNLFGAIGFYDAATKGRRQAHHWLRDVRLENRSQGSRSRQRQTESSDRSVRERTWLSEPREACFQGLPRRFLLQAARRQGPAAGAQRGLDRTLCMPERGSLCQRPHWAVSIRQRAPHRNTRTSSARIAFFLRLHDHGLEKQRKIIPDMLKISERTGIRAVASNDCHYMQKDDCRAHDLLLCIQTGKTVNDPNRMKFYTDQFYFKNRQEMDRVFGEIPLRSRPVRGNRRTLQSETPEGRQSVSGIRSAAGVHDRFLFCQGRARWVSGSAGAPEAHVRQWRSEGIDRGL